MTNVNSVQTTPMPSSIASYGTSSSYIQLTEEELTLNKLMTHPGQEKHIPALPLSPSPQTTTHMPQTLTPTQLPSSSECSSSMESSSHHDKNTNQEKKPLHHREVVQEPLRTLRAYEPYSQINSTTSSTPSSPLSNATPWQITQTHTNTIYSFVTTPPTSCHFDQDSQLSSNASINTNICTSNNNNNDNTGGVINPDGDSDWYYNYHYHHDYDHTENNTAATENKTNTPETNCIDAEKTKVSERQSISISDNNNSPWNEASHANTTSFSVSPNPLHDIHTPLTSSLYNSHSNDLMHSAMELHSTQSNKTTRGNSPTSFDDLFCF